MRFEFKNVAYCGGAVQAHVKMAGQTDRRKGSRMQVHKPAQVWYGRTGDKRMTGGGGIATELYICGDLDGPGAFLFENQNFVY